MSKKILVLGIGNYLMGDEGVGVHLAQELEKETESPDFDVLDGGTGGFHLSGYFEKYPIVILVDATLGEHSPGRIRMIEPRFSTDFPRAMSTHDIGLKDIIEGLILLDKLPKVYLFVVSIERIQPQTIELSPEIARVLPELKNRIRELIHNLKISIQ